MSSIYQNGKRRIHEPKYKYLDLTVRNFENGNGVPSRQLVFNDTRTTALCETASHYEMSVIRFSVDSFSLPCLFAPVPKNSTDAKVLSYSFVLQYNDGFGTITNTPQEFVNYTPQNINAAEPFAPNLLPNGLQNTNDPYYYVYDYQYMINLLNLTLIDVMNVLIGLVPALATVEPPFLDWLPNSDGTGIARMYARNSHFNSNSLPLIKIFMNRPLYSLFNSFNTIDDATQPSGRQHELVMNGYYGAKIVSLPNFGIDQLVYADQESSTVSNWQFASSLIFSSSSLPVTPNEMGQPIVIVDGEQITFGSNYDLTNNLITDIAVEDVWKPHLLYVPSGEYRWISLYNNSEIKNVDIAVSYRDMFGHIHPFLMAPSSTCSIKLLFRLRDKFDQDQF